MSTSALEDELRYFLAGPPLPDLLEERAAARAQRVARELARRDYRFRPHGRECQCECCADLGRYWRWMGRRESFEVHRAES